MADPTHVNFSCDCGKQLRAGIEEAGNRVRCPECDRVLKVPIPSIETTDYDIRSIHHGSADTGPGFDLETRDAPIPIDERPTAGPVIHHGGPDAARSRQYKVLSRLDDWFAAAFHPNDLEEALNFYALQGWTLHTILSVRVGPDGKDELIAVLERQG